MASSKLKEQFKTKTTECHSKSNQNKYVLPRPHDLICQYSRNEPKSNSRNDATAQIVYSTF